MLDSHYPGPSCAQLAIYLVFVFASICVIMIDGQCCVQCRRVVENVNRQVV